MCNNKARELHWSDCSREFFFIFISILDFMMSILQLGLYAYGVMKFVIVIFCMQNYII